MGRCSALTRSAFGAATHSPTRFESVQRGSGMLCTGYDEHMPKVGKAARKSSSNKIATRQRCRCKTFALYWLRGLLVDRRPGHGSFLRWTWPLFLKNSSPEECMRGPNVVRRFADSQGGNLFGDQGQAAPQDSYVLSTVKRSRVVLARFCLQCF